MRDNWNTANYDDTVTHHEYYLLIQVEHKWTLYLNADSEPFVFTTSVAAMRAKQVLDNNLHAIGQYVAEWRILEDVTAK